jgi:phosphate starvation-inducible PhoH-like protein
MAKKKSTTKKRSPRTRAVPTALNEKQGEFIYAIDRKELIVATGSAGTGKTYIAAAFAASFLAQGKVNKIVITRPNIATGKTLGHFPGTVEEKMANWVAPVMQVLQSFMGKGALECAIKNGKVIVAPFETIRGSTFNDAFVILDEAQNTTQSEIMAFLTRLGTGSTTIVTGDESQSDLKSNNNSGLAILRQMIDNRPPLQELCEVVQFSSYDIVRSGLCKLFVQEFDRL